MDNAALLEQQFLDRMQQHDLVDISTPHLILAQQQPQRLLNLFDSQLQSRQLDLWARRLQPQGEAYYSIGSSGHEAMAAVAEALNPTDPALLHYRDAAFQLQRARQVEGQNPVRDLCLSFVASSLDPISGGRHKVLGSKALNIPPQTSTIASHLPKAVGLAHGIALSRKLKQTSPYPSDAVVLCSFGDASLNHSTAQGALNTAAWITHQRLPLPLILVCEDNGLGISTPTPAGWIEASCRQRPGLYYLSCDGLDLLDVWLQMQRALERARGQRQPVLLHLRCSRLLGHAGSDNELGYLSREQIHRNLSRDPLLVSAAYLQRSGILSFTQLLERYRNTATAIEQQGDWAYRQPKLRGAEAIMQPLVPPPRASHPQPPHRPERYSEAQQLPQPLVRLLNWGLEEALQRYPQLVMMGEDIGPKGGVYQVTQGLHQRFGPQRLIDTLLDEQSILGLALGLSHHDLLPVPEIQFLAYLHNAEDQLRGEAATQSFFSQGQYANPMLIRIAGLGYQKGFGGHFHNDNALAVLRDIPGLIVACPSHGEDAVAMLREALDLVYRQRRLLVWLEPIALYRTRDLLEPGDERWCSRFSDIDPEARIELGQPGCRGEGTDLALVSYGNGHYLSCQAAEQLAQQGIACRVIDLRWLQPLPIDALIPLLQPCRHVLIVDECRRSGSVSEQLKCLLLEAESNLPEPHRLCAEDSFIVLGAGAADTLPSVESIIETAVRIVKKIPTD